MCFHQEQISNTVTVLQYSFNSGMVLKRNDTPDTLVTVLPDQTPLLIEREN